MTIKALHKSICVDTNFLICVLDINGEVFGEETRAKLDFFLANVDRAKSKLVIPTPVYAEFLIKAERASVEALKEFQSKRFVEVVPFDLAAAYECSLLDRAAINGSKDKKDGVDESWQKIKIDRQIVAIAKTKGCGLMVSQDVSVAANCVRVNIDVMNIDDLPLPPDFAQKELPLVSDKVKKLPSRPKGGSSTSSV